ncbi:hypothetical protein BJX99DRAFT_225867 [Aspergillus californicus]
MDKDSSSLVGLPPELLHIILEFLDSDPAALSGLSRTCPYLHSLVVTHLYRTVTLHNDLINLFPTTLDRLSDYNLAEHVECLTLHITVSKTPPRIRTALRLRDTSSRAHNALL